MCTGGTPTTFLGFMIEFVTLGNSNEISASCHYLNLRGTGILLDAGQDPNTDGVGGLPAYTWLEKHMDSGLDYAILSHAHHDHIGSLPVMLRHFPHARVHMTQPTRLLLDFLLPESARLQQKRFKEGVNPLPPMFNEEQAEMAAYLYRSWPLNKTFDLNEGVRAEAHVSATFYHAGHVLGAVGTMLETERDGQPFRVFFSGDLNLRAQAIQPGAEIPEGPIDVLILESTLGSDPIPEQMTRKMEEDRFLESLQRTIARKGHVLIPAFALGRSQEILSMLGRFKTQKRLPEDLTIYTAGSQRAISDIYDRTRFISPRLDEKFEVYGVEQKRLPKSKTRIETLIREGAPSVFILGSGMMFDRTLSHRLAQLMMHDARHSIYFVGYIKPDSPAMALLEAAQKRHKLQFDAHHEQAFVKCEVDRFRFSGHSNRRELLQVIEKLKPRKVLLVHGEPAAREWMKDNILHFYPETAVVLPNQCEPIYL